MIFTSIKSPGQLALTRLRFSPAQMQVIAQVGVDSVKERVSRGIGSDDAAMPPLAGIRAASDKPGRIGGYAGYKIRRVGVAIRNLRLSGEMLDALSVRAVEATSARIDITTRDGRVKAARNERRAPWFGFSPQDQANMAAASRTMLSEMVKGGLIVVDRPRRPLWMGGGTRRAAVA